MRISKTLLVICALAMLLGTGGCKSEEQIAQGVQSSAAIRDVVYNEAPERGLGSSIRTAIAALSRFDGKAAGVLFGVCDQPYLKKETVQAL